MGENVGQEGFWLPSEFFDDLTQTESDSELSFPTEFPYDLEPDTSYEHLEKKKEGGVMMSTSPQSTLAHHHMWTLSACGSTNGSPNGVSSPPTGICNDDALGDLIYRAAGQVARLKLSGGVDNGLVGPHLFPTRPKNFAPTHLHNLHFQQQQMVQQQQMYQTRSAWPMQESPARNIGPGRRGVMMGPSVKRGSTGQCAGTGVFLPRKYVGNISNEFSNAYSSTSDPPRKKTGYSAAFGANRNGQGHKTLGHMNGFGPSQPHFQPNIDPGFVLEYDLLMARRNAIMMRHQDRLLEGSTRMMMSRGQYLPQEWTY